MKNKFLFALLISVLTILSCSKESTSNDDSKTPIPSQKPISFKIDGNLITVDSAIGYLYNLEFAPFERKLDVIGYANGRIIFEANLNPTVGKQNLGDGGNSLISYRPGIDLNEHFASKTGSITISKCDTISPEIVATFETMVGQVLGGSEIKLLKEGSLKVTKLAKK